MIQSLMNVAGVPAVGMSPFAAGWRTSGRQLPPPQNPSGMGSEASLAPVRSCLEAGMVPVLHGDCVMDDQLGCTILRWGTRCAAQPGGR